jgi:hypothetical protein
VSEKIKVVLFDVGGVLVELSGVSPACGLALMHTILSHDQVSDIRLHAHDLDAMRLVAQSF